MEIDESGVSKLQSILADNRAAAQELAAAFDGAAAAVQHFKNAISTDLPDILGAGMGYGITSESLLGASGLKVNLDLSEASAALKSFTASARKPIPLSANASGIVSAARSAMSTVKSLLSEQLTLKVKAETTTDGAAKMSSGGRFSSPTHVEVAEDNAPEYIIPVRREGRAVPLLRQLLSELSPAARASVTGEGDSSSGELRGGAGEKRSGEGNPSSGKLRAVSGECLSGGAALVAAAGSAVRPQSTYHTTNTQNNHLSAPVTINVKAAGSDPEALGKGIYDAAERYFLRTVSGVMG